MFYTRHYVKYNFEKHLLFASFWQVKKKKLGTTIAENDAVQNDSNEPKYYYLQNHDAKLQKKTRLTAARREKIAFFSALCANCQCFI